MTTETYCINVTGKTPQECRQIFTQHIKQPRFKQFIKKRKGENTYYVFCHE